MIHINYLDSKTKNFSIIIENFDPGIKIPGKDFFDSPLLVLTARLIN